MYNTQYIYPDDINYHDEDYHEDLSSLDLEDQFDELMGCDCVNGCKDCLL
jgi:hypothetical protein